jgi:hypothetical protein
MKTMRKPPQRFRLSRDDDGHWYVVPAELVQVFDNWVEATSNDLDWIGENFERYSLGGDPSNVTFTDPKWGIDGISLQK